MNNAPNTSSSLASDDTLRSLEEGIAGLDKARAASLAAVSTVRAVKGAVLAREQERLTRKLGADHPRVVALVRQQQVNHGLGTHLTFAREQAETEGPTVDDQGYVFHGFVRDNLLKGVPSLTVALYDEKQQWLRALGYACTDGNGYFILRFQAPKRDEKPGEKTAQDLGIGELRTEAGSSVFVHVLDQKQNTIHVEKEPLHPALGKIDYRVIILSGQSPVCEPPNAEKEHEQGSTFL